MIYTFHQKYLTILRYQFQDRKRIYVCEVSVTPHDAHSVVSLGVERGGVDGALQQRGAQRGGQGRGGEGQA